MQLPFCGGRAATLALGGAPLFEFPDSQRRSVVDCKLLKDAMQVDLDGALANVELASDLLVRQSFGYQMRNLAFTLGHRNLHGGLPESGRYDSTQALPSGQEDYRRLRAK
jgi:hypothetical protein